MLEEKHRVLIALIHGYTEVLLGGLYQPLTKPEPNVLNSTDYSFQQFSKIYPLFFFILIILPIIPILFFFLYYFAY